MLQSNLHKRLARFGICLAIGYVMGLFWHHEWVKPCKKVSECAGVASNAQIKPIIRVRQEMRNLMNAELRQYMASNAQIKPKAEILAGRSGEMERTGKIIEVYQGIWHKDYLEVVKK